ncbi:hypothetical protein [Candidatus Methylacidiphilum fumarolicum]|nr:hypothetical protein [Candidatus Methylacidiphilum fumarolicum]
MNRCNIEWCQCRASSLPHTKLLLAWGRLISCVAHLPTLEVDEEAERNN